MSKDTKQTPVELARTATEEAVKYSENISAEVRDITIEALRRHQLDLEHIKAVIKAVLAGAEDAALRGLMKPWGNLHMHQNWQLRRRPGVLKTSPNTI